MTTATALSLSDSVRALAVPPPVQQAILDEINGLGRRRQSGSQSRQGVKRPTPLGQRRVNESEYRWHDDGSAVCESRSGEAYLLSWAADPEWGFVATECSCAGFRRRETCRHLSELQTAMTERLREVLDEAAEAAADYERLWCLWRMGLSEEAPVNAASRRLEAARAAADKSIARAQEARDSGEGRR